MSATARMGEGRAISATEPAVLTGLALYLLLLAAMACVTWFVLDPLKDALATVVLADGHSADWRALLRTALQMVAPWQVALVAAIPVLGVAVVGAEWIGGAYSTLLRAQSWPLMVGFAATLAWLGHSYLGRGDLLAGDIIAHMSMLITRTNAFLAGADPSWSNFKQLGLPLQEFYAPTTFWPVTWLAALLGDVTLALRLFLFAAHLLSGVALYALGREMRLSRLGAVVAALAYAGAFAHLHLLLYRGALPQALSAALLPAAMLFLLRVVRRPALGLDWAGLVASAALLLMNYTPLAIVGAVYMAVLGLGMMDRGTRKLPLLAGLAAAAVLAGLLAACVLIPAAMAPNEVLPIAMTELLRLAWPFPGYFDQLLVWRAWRTNFPGAAAYLGIVAVVFALGAVVRACLPAGAATRRIVLLLGACLLLSLVLRGPHVRDVMFNVLFVALLAGFGVDGALAGRLRGKLPVLVLALFLLDLGSTAVQPVGRTDKVWLDEAGRFLAAQTPPSRTIDATVEGRRLVAPDGPSQLAWHPIEFPAAGHVEMATPAWVYGDLASRLAVADLNAHARLEPATNTLMCLMRVGRIVGLDRAGMGLPAWVAGTRAEGPLGAVLVPDCPYSVVFSRALVPSPLAPMDPRIDYRLGYVASLLPQFRVAVGRLLEVMGIDPATGAARVLPIRDLPAPVGTEGAATAGVKVSAYAVTASRVAIELLAPEAGFVRLSHAWHPRLVVSRNGAPVPVWRDVTGVIVAPVVEGENRIEIVPGPEPSQVLGNRVSLAALPAFALLVGACLLRRRRRPA